MENTRDAASSGRGLHLEDASAASAYDTILVLVEQCICGAASDFIIAQAAATVGDHGVATMRPHHIQYCIDAHVCKGQLSGGFFAQSVNCWR